MNRVGNSLGALRQEPPSAKALRPLLRREYLPGLQIRSRPNRPFGLVQAVARVLVPPGYPPGPLAFAVARYL